jgi:hypothetical protein
VKRPLGARGGAAPKLPAGESRAGRGESRSMAWSRLLPRGLLSAGDEVGVPRLAMGEDGASGE